MQVPASPYKQCKMNMSTSELIYLMMFYLHPFFPPPSHRKHRRDRAVRPGAVWVGDPVRRPDQDAEAGSQVPVQEVLWDMWGETWAGLGGANRKSGTCTRSTMGHVRWDMGGAGWGKQASQVPLQEVLWDMWGETWVGLGGANRKSGTSTRSTVGHVRWDMGGAGWGKQGVRYLYKKYCGTCEVRHGRGWVGQTGSQVPLQEVLWDMWGETWAGLGGANRESGTSTRSTVGHVRWDMGGAHRESGAWVQEVLWWHRWGWVQTGSQVLYKKYCGTCEVRHGSAGWGKHTSQVPLQEVLWDIEVRHVVRAGWQWEVCYKKYVGHVR